MENPTRRLSGGVVVPARRGWQRGSGLRRQFLSNASCSGTAPARGLPPTRRLSAAELRLYRILLLHDSGAAHEHNSSHEGRDVGRGTVLLDPANGLRVLGVADAAARSEVLNVELPGIGFPSSLPLLRSHLHRQSRRRLNAIKLQSHHPFIPRPLNLAQNA